jgi:hypothetical protein
LVIAPRPFISIRIDSPPTTVLNWRTFVSIRRASAIIPNKFQIVRLLAVTRRRIWFLLTFTALSQEHRLPE